MQITINQSEIEAAIRAHILSQINIKEGHEISITLKATRGEDGTTAIIDIERKDETTKVIPSGPVTRTPRITRDEPKEAVAASSEEAEQPAATEQADKPRKPTLFGSLKQPVNTPAETASAE